MINLWKRLWGLDRAEREDYVKIFFWYIYKKLIIVICPIILAIAYFVYNYIPVE